MSDLINQCLALCDTVHKTLGPGHKEIIYHRAFLVELRNTNLSWESEKCIPVMYKDIQVGNIISDIIINNILVLEFKAVAKDLSILEIRQTKKYMECADIKYGLLVNFWNNSLVHVDELCLNDDTIVQHKIILI